MSISSEEQIPETGDDILILCAGKCGKKILTFGISESEGSLCLECLSKPLRGDLEKPDESQ